MTALVNAIITPLAAPQPSGRVGPALSTATAPTTGSDFHRSHRCHRSNCCHSLSALKLSGLVPLAFSTPTAATRFQRSHHSDSLSPLKLTATTLSGRTTETQRTSRTAGTHSNRCHGSHPVAPLPPLAGTCTRCTAQTRCHRTTRTPSFLAPYRPSHTSRHAPRCAPRRSISHNVAAIAADKSWANLANLLPVVGQLFRAFTGRFFSGSLRRQEDSGFGRPPCGLSEIQKSPFPTLIQGTPNIRARATDVGIPRTHDFRQMRFA